MYQTMKIVWFKNAYKQGVLSVSLNTLSLLCFLLYNITHNNILSIQLVVSLHISKQLSFL